MFTNTFKNAFQQIDNFLFREENEKRAIAKQKETQRKKIENDFNKLKTSIFSPNTAKVLQQMRNNPEVTTDVKSDIESLGAEYFFYKLRLRGILGALINEDKDFILTRTFTYEKYLNALKESTNGTDKDLSCKLLQHDKKKDKYILKIITCNKELFYKDNDDKMRPLYEKLAAQNYAIEFKLDSELRSSKK